MAEIVKYTGKIELQPKPAEVDEETGQLLFPYLPGEELVEAINLAIFLERPLFLRGEPGCGKTKLARAVAYELKLPYEGWHVKSTSRAQDGLYAYDAVRRLHDAQVAGLGTILTKRGKVSESRTILRGDHWAKRFRMKHERWC